ncbi:MAG: sensor histidine kinase [Actinomycetota bacterium]
MTAAADAARSPAPRVRWPWLVIAFFLLVAGVALVLVAENGESLAEQVPYVIAFGMFGIVGAVILSRARANRVGSLLLWASTITALAFLCGEVFTWLVRNGTTSGPAITAVGLASNAGWVLGLMPVLLFLPLLFPDGRLPSKRWRVLAWLDVLTLVFLGGAATFGLERLEGNIESVTIANPVFVEAFAAIEISDAVINALLLACLVGGMLSLVVRFRRASGVERQQIKWVVASVVFLLVSFLASSIAIALTSEDNFFVDAILGGAAFLSLPVAIGIGVLQFRLYDLDVVVQKALIAGTLVVVVVAVYGAVVWAFGTVASEGESSVTVFVIALVLGIAFRPVTRVARRLADRVVYGRRATPYEVLTEFSERVGDAYATEDVLSRMARILGEGVGATSARVWLHVGADLRPASAWPESGPVAPLAVNADRVPEIPGETVVEVRDRGMLLGALSVAVPTNDPMTPAKEKLVRDLASQAGLVLRNVRLVEELRASQRRLVAARDEERRRIERNIHDGAQQQLVALSVQARLVRGLAGRDAAKADELLSSIEAQLQTALEDLRDLARGIYPPLLADKGLGPALEAQARRSAVPVTVEAQGLARYPQEIEAAVYFSCLEALQNVAKYADADSARVRLVQVNGDLTFEVADDGRGFDPEATGYGTGLQGIADRLGALDGTLAVRSRPGDGTVVSGRVGLHVGR